jgi:cytochrome c-type biogenesis protein CcmH/NrfF
MEHDASTAPPTNVLTLRMWSLPWLALIVVVSVRLA